MLKYYKHSIYQEVIKVYFIVLFALLCETAPHYFLSIDSHKTSLLLKEMSFGHVP